MTQLILNLCSGLNPMVGAVNVDARHLPGVDQVVDLNVLPWPWGDSSVDGIVAKDALEHIAPLGVGAGQANISAVMAEVWRVLKPGGKINIKVPSTDGRGAWQDPTHVTYWNRNTFEYFRKGSDLVDLYDTTAVFDVEMIENIHAYDVDVVWVSALLVAVKEEA